MNEYERLSNSRWECKCYVVFIPKGRRKVLYGQLWRAFGRGVSKVGPAEGTPD